jgi:hypothetical protein
MPALVLFRHGASLTFAIIARRVNKRDAGPRRAGEGDADRDIRCASPHRAHLEILRPGPAQPGGEAHLANFADLQRAWEKTLDTSELNKKFFREVANWYFWAVQNVVFPDGAGADPETRNAVSVIRLITRLIFVWFIREKGLVPDELFDQRRCSRCCAGTTPRAAPTTRRSCRTCSSPRSTARWARTGAFAARTRPAATATTASRPSIATRTTSPIRPRPCACSPAFPS